MVTKSSLQKAVICAAIYFAPSLLAFMGGIFSPFGKSVGLFAQSVGINSTGVAPNTSALLDVNASPGNDKGLLIPRLTTAQRNAIVSPATSLLIYNVTTDCLEMYSASAVWISIGCGCQMPGSFSANAASSILQTSATANWSASSGATDYVLDVSTTNTFGTFVAGYNNLNVGNVLTYNITGLTCGTTYYYRVRANNACGTSPNSAVITFTTAVCSGSITCGSQVFAAANLDVGTMVIGLQTTAPGGDEKYCFQDVPANCATYGGLYDWNEAMNYSASVNCDPCGSSGVQGICPSGFHIPSDLEWSRYEYCLENNIAPTGTTSLIDFQTINGFRGSSVVGEGPGDKMKSSSPIWDGTNTSGFNGLPAGHSDAGGTFFNAMGTYGYYTTSTEVDATDSWHRVLGTGLTQGWRRTYSKTAGLSVRCLQN